MAKNKKTEDFKDVISSPIKISVTADDIKNGKPINERCCPIALAASRVIKKGEDETLYVGMNFLAIETPEKPYDKSVQIPRVATDFILSFDKGEEVFPFEFEIDGRKFST